MIDIHTHLHFKDYDADRDAVIARAREAGVEKMILIGTDIESSRAAVALAEQHDFLFASVGIHPHFFDEIESEMTDSKLQISNKSQISNQKIKKEIEALRMIAEHRRVVAIGECGLDYFSRSPKQPITDEQRAMQHEGFLAQMSVAREFGLPIIIHTRPSAGSMDAYEDVFAVLSDPLFAVRDSKFVMHCYQGDAEITKKFLGIPNMYFSFTGSITYPVKKTSVGTKDDPVEVIQRIPIERIFVETDCPYLAPQPVRGTRNEPAYVAMIAERIAEVKGIDQEESESNMRHGFSMVFRWSKMEG